MMRLEITKATFKREFGLNPDETASMTSERRLIWELTLNKLMEKQADLISYKLSEIIAKMFKK
jgi:hypothetical protein